MIDEVPKSLEPIPNDAMHGGKDNKPFDATHNIIPLQLTRVTTVFDVKKLLQRYEDSDTLKIELMVQAPLWNLSSPELRQMEKNLSILLLQQRGY